MATSLAENAEAGTVLGMHYQVPPAQAQLVRCASGHVYDVVLEVRRGSPAFGRWADRAQAAKEGAALSVPAGCAHGYKVMGSRQTQWTVAAATLLPHHRPCVREQATGASMRFSDTEIGGLVVVDLDALEDERGSFARAFCAAEFEKQGLDGHVEQANISTSIKAGTLRGLHYQLPPSAETKLVRCVRGALFDVAVDIRPSSRTFAQWFGIELTEDNGVALLVPPGFAHGFQTLVDETTAMYMVSAAYDRERERGVHHADPAISIGWPIEVTNLSMRDRGLPYLADADLA